MSSDRKFIPGKPLVDSTGDNASSREAKEIAGSFKGRPIGKVIADAGQTVTGSTAAPVINPKDDNDNGPTLTEEEKKEIIEKIKGEKFKTIKGGRDPRKALSEEELAKALGVKLGSNVKK